MENVFIIQVYHFLIFNFQFLQNNKRLVNIFFGLLDILYLFFFSDDPEPYILGTRINSPHYLCKIVLNDKTPSKFTLVVSQYEKMNTIHYTLRAYATCPFSMKELSNSYEAQFKTVIFIFFYYA